MIRKDLLFAVLATFCLCALMFSVIPIDSGLPYDPWTDINEDGTINMRDVGNVAAQFGTTGDPTKNVTLGSLNYYEWYGDVLVEPRSVTNRSYVYLYYPIAGFRQVSLCLWYEGGEPWHRVAIEMGTLETEYPGGSYYITFYENIDTPNGVMGNYEETIPVQGPGLAVIIFTAYMDWSEPTQSFTARVGVYATC